MPRLSQTGTRRFVCSLGSADPPIGWQVWSSKFASAQLLRSNPFRVVFRSQFVPSKRIAFQKTLQRPLRCFSDHTIWVILRIQPFEQHHCGNSTLRQHQFIIKTALLLSLWLLSSQWNRRLRSCDQNAYGHGKFNYYFQYYGEFQTDFRKEIKWVISVKRSKEFAEITGSRQIDQNLLWQLISRLNIAMQVCVFVTP